MLIDKLRSIQSSQNKPSILVIGDLMIDHYVWGSASRLSAEAPVPIVNVTNETVTLGGAGNVVQNLVALGAHVTISGVIGDDTSGTQLTEIMKSEGVKTDTVIKDSTRPTTVKTRVMVGSHQLIRVDKETTDHISAELENDLIDRLTASIDTVDLIILSDYNKGLFTPAFTGHIIKIAHQHNKKVIIDPKGLNYEKYAGAFLIKPNRKELAEAAKAESVKDLSELREAAKIIFSQTHTEYLVVTLSEDGMAILTREDSKLLPVKATEVFDVTGAGDTVIAAIAYFVASGLSVEDACESANFAAANVVKRVGSVTVTLNDIIHSMETAN